MSLYFTTQHIPELAGLNFQQRMAVVKQAVNQLSVPQKVLLNLLKVIVLVHFFSVLARFEGWLLIPYLLGAGLIYPLVINPVSFMMSRKEMAGARKKLAL